MSEPDAPRPRTMLAAAIKPGRHGAAGAAPLRIAERQVSVVQVTQRKGREQALAQAVRAAFGSDPPGPGRALLQGDVATIWIQPGSWLVIEPWKAEAALARRIAGALATTASIVDQTFGKAVVRVSGAPARDVLAKGCRIDLHPRVFQVGFAATTPIAHINTTLVQIDEAPTFDLVLPATLAESFLAWLAESAASTGYEMAAP